MKFGIYSYIYINNMDSSVRNLIEAEKESQTIIEQAMKDK